MYVERMNMYICEWCGSDFREGTRRAIGVLMEDVKLELGLEGGRKERRKGKLLDRGRQIVSCLGNILS